MFSPAAYGKLLRNISHRQNNNESDIPGTSGIQLALELQKNSPFGGKASGSSKDPTQR